LFSASTSGNECAPSSSQIYFATLAAVAGRSSVGAALDDQRLRVLLTGSVDGRDGAEA
jgi:hypothetical protein